MEYSAKVEESHPSFKPAIWRIDHHVIKMALFSMAGDTCDDSLCKLWAKVSATNPFQIARTTALASAFSLESHVKRARADDERMLEINTTRPARPTESKNPPGPQKSDGVGLGLGVDMARINRLVRGITK